MYPPPIVVRPALPTSGLAVASLVLGIIGAVGGWCMFAIPCLVAILLGHLALAETKTGQKAGHGMAVAGLVLGYVFGAPWLLLAFWSVLGGAMAPFVGS